MLALTFATMLSIAVGIIAAWSILRTFSDMGNPCVQWAPVGTKERTATIAPRGCSSITVHGQTRLQASVVSSAIPGGLLVSIALFCGGIVSGRRPLMKTAAVLMLVDTLVVFTIFPLTLLTGMTFAYIAYARS
jgi:hypothetical protein